MPDRGLPTTKNGGSARVTAAPGSRSPARPASRRLFTSGPESRKGGPRASHPQGPGRQPRRDRPPRAAHGARHGARAAWRSTPTPTRGAPHVAEADEAVRIGPPPSRESYLAIDRILAARARDRRRRRAPGLRLPGRERRVRASAAPPPGLTFIGPPPSAIRAMGSKIEAKRIMAEAGVPVIPGVSGAGLTDEALAAGRERIGFPLLVKASAGGGGKGMRVVRDAASLPGALAAARREAARRLRRRHAAGRALRRARRVTSRSRSSATPTATWCISSSASARSSAATRRSSRRRRRRRCSRRCAPAWATRP